MNRAPALVALVAGALVSRAVQANPLLDASVGGPVFVGPTSPHVSSLFWNPAATGLLSGTHVFVQGAARLDQTTIDRADVSPADGEPAVGGPPIGSISTLPITPGGFAGAMSDFATDRVTVGLAIYPLYRVEHIEDESALAYHADGGSHYGWETTLALSLRASRTLYFGVGFSALLTRLDLSFRRDLALDTCAAAPCDVENPANAQRFRLRLEQSVGDLLDEPAISYSVGLLAKIEGWWLGASWFSAPLSASGVVTRSAEVDVSGAGVAGTVSGDARVSFGMPAMLHVGARRPLAGDYELVLGFRWASLSAHDEYDVRLIDEELIDAGLPEWIVRYRGFQDVINVEAGLENQPGAPLRLGGRLRFETSAVPTARVSPAQIDAPKLALLLGAEVRLHANVALTVGYTLAYYLPQDVEDSVFRPSSAIACNASGHELDSCTDVRLGRAIPSAAGSYERLSHDLRLGVSVDVW